MSSSFAGHRLPARTKVEAHKQAVAEWLDANSDVLMDRIAEAVAARIADAVLGSELTRRVDRRLAREARGELHDLDANPGEGP